MPRRAATGLVKTSDDTLAEVRGSMVQIRIHGRTYDAVRDPNCPVCMHPGRVKIEERVLFNDTFPAIAEFVSEVDHEEIDGHYVRWPKLEAKQIASHFRRHHCPVDARMLHDLTIERDRSMNEGYEQLTTRAVDAVVLSKMVMARGQERLVRGEIEPDMRQTLAAAKIVAAIEVAAQQSETEDKSWFYEQAMQRYFDLTREIMNEEQWNRYSVAINSDPTLRRLVDQAQGNVIDAEVVEEEAV